MKVGIVGLGLIGGSFAKAYSKDGHSVYAADTDEAILRFAMLSGAVREQLDESNVSDCDLILICTYPEAAVHFMEDKGPLFGTKPIVIDCCGTKGNIVDKGFALAEQYGFTYLGGHPMAGKERSGYANAEPTLFRGASMIFTPFEGTDPATVERLKAIFAEIGFARFVVTDPKHHDEMIAYTSQLAHVVSSAYVRDELAAKHLGFSAGSYQDMTRVATVDPDIWTDLFLSNREALGGVLGRLIERLGEYREAIGKADAGRLRELLAEGRAAKERAH